MMPSFLLMTIRNWTMLNLLLGISSISSVISTLVWQIMENLMAEWVQMGEVVCMDNIVEDLIPNFTYKRKWKP